MSLHRTHQARLTLRSPHRRLIVEPLERREMLSVSLGSDDPAPAAEVGDSAEVSSLAVDDVDAPVGQVSTIDFSPWAIEYAASDLDFERSRVAVEGDVMAVGLPLDDSLAQNAGSVNVYRRVGGVWQKDAAPLASPRGEADRFFGNRVALVGDRLFVTSASTVYVFRAGPLGAWQIEAELTPEVGSGFGVGLGEIDTDGQRLIVSTSSFSAAVFSRDGEAWREEVVLSIAETVDVPSQSPDSLVAIDGDVAVLRTDRWAMPEGMRNLVHVFEFAEGIWSERQQLIIDSQDGEDVTAVEIDGDTIAIAIQSGSVIDLYHRGEEGWQRSAKLYDPGRSFLGAEIVLHGDTLLLGHYPNGSPTTSTSGEEILGGSVTVFRRDGAGWHEETVLAAPNSRHLDRFGISFATDGETIVVAAMAQLEYNDWVGPPSGIYVFALGEVPIHEPPAGIPPDDPIVDDPIEVSDPLPQEDPVEIDSTIDFSPWAIEYAEADLDFFRAHVAVDGDVMVVRGLAGSVNVYRRMDGAWQKDPAPLASPRGEADRAFGRRVALEGDRLFVASSRTVYVFRAGPLGTWQIEAELTPETGSGFGEGLGEIDTDGQRLIVGTSSFSAAVFSRDGEVWREEGVLSVAEAVDAPSPSFYLLVSIDGDAAVLRADVNTLIEGMKDRVHVFEFAEGMWSERQQLIIDSQDGEDVTAVGIDGDTIAIAIQSGNVIDLYQRGEDGWQRSTKLRTNDAYRTGSRSMLGAEMVLQGDTLLLGHYTNWSPTTSTSGEEILGGSVTVFRRDGNTWHEETILAAPNSRHLDQFGLSFATDGQTIVVTAVAQLERNDWVGPPSGIYVFALGEVPFDEPPPTKIPPDDPITSIDDPEIPSVTIDDPEIPKSTIDVPQIPKIQIDYPPPAHADNDPFGVVVVLPVIPVSIDGVYLIPRVPEVLLGGEHGDAASSQFDMSSLLSFAMSVTMQGSASFDDPPPFGDETELPSESSFVAQEGDEPRLTSSNSPSVDTPRQPSAISRLQAGSRLLSSKENKAIESRDAPGDEFVADEQANSTSDAYGDADN
jgi:hypothetical protein